MCQVILKNTSVVKNAASSTPRVPINRSQSLSTINSRVPVIAPSRGERARLEALLSDVWTRDILPFPGITARSRSEHLVRASATSMMRKLSVASIASTFTKRTPSTASSAMSAGQYTATTSSGQQKDMGAAAAGMDYETHDGSGRSLLSEAPDEGGRPSPSVAAVDSEWDADVLQTVRCLDAIKVQGECQEQEMPPALPSPPKDSSNITGPRRQDSMAPTRGSEEEDICPPPHAKTRPHKFQSRWAARVGALHRQVVVRVIRSVVR